MYKEKKDKHFLKKPEYIGGKEAMRAFIRENLEYPEAALRHKTEGTVFLKYTINHVGKVVETKIISSLGNGCDEEAERLVSMFKFYVPKTRGVKVLYHKNIQIHFRLPKAEVKPVEQVKPAPAKPAVINYNYVPAKASPTPGKAAPPKKASYTIQIKL